MVSVFINVTNLFILLIVSDLKLVEKNINNFYEKRDHSQSFTSSNPLLNNKSVNLSKIIQKITNLLEIKEKNIDTRRYSLNDNKLEQGLQQNGLSLVKNDEFSKDIIYYNSMFRKIKQELHCTKVRYII